MQLLTWAGYRYWGRYGVVSPPTKLKRVLNNVSSSLTILSRLTNRSKRRKNESEMAFLSDSKRWVSSLCTCFLVLLVAWNAVSAQKIVDKTVATVSDGFQTELITLSDLRWQLALQPGTNLVPAGSDDLNAALRSLIDQRIFALEAKRLPRNPASEKEVADEIKTIISRFPTAGQFETRL